MNHTIDTALRYVGKVYAILTDLNMKSKEMFAIAPKTDLLHKRYGIVTVEYIIPDLGVVIQPKTEIGKKILQRDSGAEFGKPLLEDNPSQIDYIFLSLIHI